MQFFTFLIEFFLIGLLTLGGMIPLLSSSQLNYLSSGISSSDIAKIYVVGICYVLGIVFHFLARIIFNFTEVAVARKIIEKHQSFRIHERCRDYLPEGSENLAKGPELRRLFRMLRQSISFRSDSQYQFLKEQDQLLRITRGLILPVFLTSLTLIFRYFEERNSLPINDNLAGLLPIASCFMLLISIASYFAFIQRIKDYHRNTLAAYLSSTPLEAMGAAAPGIIKRSGYSIVVFDLDGTILNSLPSQESAWNLAIQEAGAGVSGLQQKIIIRNLYDGLSGDQMFLGTNLDLHVKKLLREKKNAYYLSLTGSISLFPEVHVMLDELKKYYRLAIATTSSKEITLQFLKKFGLQDHFSSVMTADDLDSSKPDPEILMKTAELFGADRENVLFVGDSLNDWITSRLANTDFILAGFDKKIAPGWAHSIPVIRHPAELIQLLSKA